MMSRFIKSFGYAFSGLIYAFKSQVNFKVHILAAVLVAAAAFWYRLSSSECLWLIVAVGVVLITELLNTAIEVLVDLVSPEIHPKAKIIKDAAAAAVLVAAFVALAIGLIVFLPKVFNDAA